MDETELARVVGQVGALVEEHYIFPEVATAVSRRAGRRGWPNGRYPADARALAAAVTADLQSVNGDKHLRLLYHDEVLPERTPGDDAEEYAAHGAVGRPDLRRRCVRPAPRRQRRLPGTAADTVPGRHLRRDHHRRDEPARGHRRAASSTCATARAASPAWPSFLASFLWDHEPVQLTGLRERKDSLLKQAWTLPYVPGRRFGKTKPVYVLTSASTFSGGEQLSYDLQQLGRATIVGERTRGGAHAREGFVVHPHLEATISVAESVNPKTGGNWEGTGVAPDIETTAGPGPRHRLRAGAAGRDRRARRPRRPRPRMRLPGCEARRSPDRLTPGCPTAVLPSCHGSPQEALDLHPA